MEKLMTSETLAETSDSINEVRVPQGFLQCHARPRPAPRSKREEAIVIPKEISGFREWLPEERILEQKFIDIFRMEYERYGFVPIETAAVERNEVLEAKGVASKEIYRLTRLAAETQEKEKDRDFSLHFDLTVPFARYAAQNYPKLVFPFKRYQIQKVWRGERPGEGRFREFYQADIDVIGDGSLSLNYDAEVLSVVSSIFEKLNIGKYVIRINNRKLLRGIFRELNLPTDARISYIFQHVTSLIDGDGSFNPIRKGIRTLTELLHLDQEGRQAKQILRWIQDYPEKTAKEKIIAFEEGRIIKYIDAIEKVPRVELFDDLVNKLDVPPEAADRLLSFFSEAISLQSNGEVFEYFRSFSQNPTFLEGVAELEDLFGGAVSLGLKEGLIKIDPTIARGLDYYTGVVYETNLIDHPEVGSVCSGGRYENLAGHFSRKVLPGVGVSIGLTRLLHVCFKHNLVKVPTPITCKLLIVSCEGKVTPEMLRMASYFREKDVPCEVFLEEKPLRVQMKYADKKGFHHVIIYKQEDYELGQYVVRDMQKGEQIRIALPALLTLIT